MIGVMLSGKKLSYLIMWQLFRFRLIKFSTLVALLPTVCICDDHDIVLSKATPKYVYDNSLYRDYDLT